MLKHIGVKMINAKPMNRLEYNHLRGWAVPADENPTDDGFLVEYIDGGTVNHPDFKGYISWSPKDVFENSYRPVTGLSFGLAIEALKLGKKVCRAGWNGKGMWLSLSTNGNCKSRNIAYENFWSDNNSEFARLNGGGAEVLPCITMKTADDKILMGWLASQTDMLADDWMIVE